MSNLLPSPAQRTLTRFYQRRILAMTSLLLAGTGVVAGALLLPSFLIVYKQRAALAQDLAVSETPDAIADQTFLKHIQSRMSQLGPLVVATTTPSQMIDSVLALRPSGVTIDRILYSTAKTKTVQISGTSDSGERVNAYQRALAQSNKFASVLVPVGALVGINEGRFNITIVGK